jgi:hypothetical protein
MVAGAMVALCAPGCSAKGSARPTAPTILAPTTTVVSTDPSVSTTIPVATTTVPPVDVVDLSSCPREYPSTSPSTPTATELSQRLVPIDALNIRVCEYARSGSTSHVTGISWLALSVARAFEAETNRLATASETPAACTGTKREATAFLLTYAVDAESVNVNVGDCPLTASNGPLTVPVSARWYADLVRYASAATISTTSTTTTTVH